MVLTVPTTPTAAAAPAPDALLAGAAGMRVEIPRAMLHGALLDVIRAVATRPGGLPQLADVLLRADGARLTLVATDLQVALIAEVDAVVAVAGAITVPARLLSELVASLPEAPVTLAADPTALALQVRCARVRATIKGHDADDYPQLPGVGAAPPLARFAAADLRQALGQVVFAAATDDRRPLLTGVCWEFADGRLTLVAADGVRLSCRLVALGQPVAATTLLAPARSMAELVRLLGDRREPVEFWVSADGHRAIVQCGRVQLHTRLLGEAYVAYRQLLPTTVDTRVVLTTAELRRAIELARTFTDTTQRIHLAVSRQQGALTVSAQAAERGAGETSVAVAALDGVELAIAFDARYLIEVLAVMRAEQVALEFRGALDTATLRPVGAEDVFLHLIMPLSPPPR
ncbi:MAG: DNA polymerase III subunit beta [Chloroflexi bacterium]|nr:DNA polymerase III subunit beta [Chloroflexota bacterium]